MAKNNTYNTHHRLARSQDGTNHPDNLLRIKERTHNAFHLVFENGTFRDQLSILRDYSSTALSEEVKSDIIKILSNEDIEYWYKKHIYKHS